MIIKLTVNDNDFTEVLEGFANNLIDRIRDFYRERPDGMNELDYYRAYRERERGITAVLGRETKESLTKEDKILIKLAINTAWIKYIDRLHKEEKTKDYLKDNLKIKIGFDYTDKWENGEAVYYFTMSQIYITQ